MNLFAVKWGPHAAHSGDLARSLGADGMYPELQNDHRVHTWDSSCSTVAFAAVHDDERRVKPRVYVHEDEYGITTYDGLPVDSTRGFRAHVASDMAANWANLGRSTDGFYGALRISKEPLTLDVQTDLFGTYKLYCWTDNRTWIVSNSVDAIDATITSLSLDVEAAGQFLCLSWVPTYYTLVSEVRCLAPGQRTHWSRDRRVPAVTQMFELRDLLPRPRVKPRPDLAASLKDDLVDQLDAIGSSFPNVLCPLTGGKDSRLIAALLREAGAGARHYTYGNAVGRDAEIAAQVASALGVEHENLITTTNRLFANWDELAARFVARGAGMCPLQLVTGVMTAGLVDGDTKPVRLWGAGSSVCRPAYFDPLEYVRPESYATVTTRLRRFMVRDFRGLIRAPVLDNAAQYLDGEFERYAAEGVPARDLPDIFWLYERGATRSAKNMRATMNHRDTYSPFFTRAFVSASLALSPLQRVTEPLHFRLLGQAFPEGLRIPLDKGGWKTQNPGINLANELRKIAAFRARHFAAKRLPFVREHRVRHMLVSDSMFERLQWLRMLRKNIRELALEPSNSEIFELIDRKKFLHVTREDVSDRELGFFVVPLFGIGTVLLYRQERARRRRNMSNRPRFA